MIKKLIYSLFLLLIFKTEAQTSVLKVADSLLQTGNYKAALVALEKQKNPSFAELQKTGSIYKTVGSYTKAVESYQKAYAKKPSEKVKEEIGRCFQALGNAEKAINIYKEVLEANPNNLLLKYHLAKLYMGNRQSKKAKALIEELIQKDPENPNYHYQLGEIINKQKKDPTKAYLKAYDLDTTHVKSIYELARFFKKVKVRDSSELFINKGLHLFPKSLNFLQLKAQNEYRKKEYDSTLVYLKKLEKLKFETPFTFDLFGRTYHKLKDYEKAIEYFEKATGRNQQDGSLNYRLGLAYYELKNYTKAEMNFFIAVYKDRTDLSEYYYHMALSQSQKKNLKKAIKSLERGLQNNPIDPNLMYQLAITTDSYYKDKKIALKHYEKFVARYKDYDKERAAFAEQRIKEIKKALFINVEKED